MSCIHLVAIHTVFQPTHWRTAVNGDFMQSMKVLNKLNDHNDPLELDENWSSTRLISRSV